MNKKELMGSIVTVYTRLIRVIPNHSGGRLREWHRQNLLKPWAGWVVGFRTKSNGRIVFDPEDGNHWEPHKPISVIMVSSWLTTNPIPVPLDGFTMGGVPKSPQHNLTDEEKEWYKKESKTWPRDSKGRWIKE